MTTVLELMLYDMVLEANSITIPLGVFIKDTETPPKINKTYDKVMIRKRGTERMAFFYRKNKCFTFSPNLIIRQQLYGSWKHHTIFSWYGELFIPYHSVDGPVSVMYQDERITDVSYMIRDKRVL